MFNPHQYHRRPHREVTAHLVTSGWGVCGVGEWAVTLRSPDGRLAARVCPFDPAYPVFLRLCRDRPDDPFLPRVDAHVELDGGASLTVMEFLRRCSPERAATVVADWQSRTPAVAGLREAAETFDAKAADTIAWWHGIDLNEGNIMVSLDGHTKFVDIFCVDGASYYEALLHDPAALDAVIPESQRRHMTDIALIHRDSSLAEIAALHHAANPAR